MKILFLCVANSARSQMAKGFAKALYPSSILVESAGSEPSGVIHLNAITVMREIGIDISRNCSKAVDALPPSFHSDLDFAITLCAEKICPTLQSRIKIHWNIPDPAAVEGSDMARLLAYRSARDAIKKKAEDLGKELGFLKFNMR